MLNLPYEPAYWFAVLHYDLCWNPTRHEQREGRVDRFGQKAPEVRVLTFYGRDNPIDGVILDVLFSSTRTSRVTSACPLPSPARARRSRRPWRRSQPFAASLSNEDPCGVLSEQDVRQDFDLRSGELQFHVSGCDAADRYVEPVRPRGLEPVEDRSPRGLSVGRVGL